MEPKPIVVVPPKSIPQGTKRMLRKAGYVVVECDRPDLFHTIMPPAPPLPLERLPVDGVAAISLAVLADEKIDDWDVRKTFRDRVTKAAIEAEKSGGGKDVRA